QNNRIAAGTRISSQPPHTVTGPLRSCRQVLPSLWISTPVSGPRTVVKWASPERTARHTGALLPGRSACRSACASALDSVCAARCACTGVAATSRARSQNTRTSSNGHLSRLKIVFMVASSLGAVVLVLTPRTVLQRGLPRRPVALEGRPIPGRGVGLALVGALLVDGDLGLFAAGTQSTDERGGEGRGHDPLRYRHAHFCPSRSCLRSRRCSPPP